ncbi:piggyBac transposable element-derived protein 2-like [Schistocerca serialis cubense]|uniref:piggyBac transposable element-derived protein 2-like n=1 Tax=Schistocerca serialis cubense TaxID=2023355 RepID=UPI00214F3E0F|nr:piggyBac transposable element-derived protein 2-like [Schistocerca serialis cubense]
MLVRSDQKLAVTKWMDNKSVVMLSTAQCIEPSDTCWRWSKKESKYLHIEEPSVIKNYNQNMGGVDMADPLNSYCPMGARTKKWTLRTICHFTDAVCNSWLQYKEEQKESNTPAKESLQLRSFKMILALQLLNRNKTVGNQEQQETHNDNARQEEPETSAPKRRKPITLPPPQTRKQTEHMPEIIETKVFQKCHREYCKKHFRAKYVTCKVFLCLNAQRKCLAAFHSS